MVKDIEKTKEELISAEIRKLKRIFKNLDKDAKTFAEKLIKKAAFMDVTLEELQRKVADEGTIVTAVNGNGFEVTMEHPALKTYNTMIKNYIQTMKQLADFLPEDTEELDELTSFIKERKK